MKNGHISSSHRKAQAVDVEAGVLLYTPAIWQVLTPLKVHSARLPLSFGLFYTKISKLDKSYCSRLRLPYSFVNRWRVSTSVFAVWISAGRSPSKRR